MASNKSAEIGCRVSADFKRRILAIARSREESESVIVREALVAYLARYERREPLLPGPGTDIAEPIAAEERAPYPAQSEANWQPRV